MDALCAEKPPWRSVQWVRSPLAAPPITFGRWLAEANPEALALKESIGELDREHKWELAKKMVNPYELVYTQSDQRLPPALALCQPLSRSYFKMVEMLDVLGTFATPVARIRTAHVAEGPGGFIQAIVERANEKGCAVTQATAMTLKPSAAHVPGWRKAAQFLQRNRQVLVHYGADGTGNLYGRANQDSFVATAGQVNLFTADGGFDFSVDYSQQEMAVYRLLLCSAIVGLQVLKPGGAFVLKLFDCESAATRALILLLGRQFTEWTLYRPAMTRPCNSERYFLGRGFRGGAAVPILREALERIDEELYPVVAESAWTETERVFLATHLAMTAALQMLSIRQAIVFCHDPATWRQWHRACIQKSYSWCEAFRVPAKPIAEFLRLT
jgi:23S rRNA U2552 (ribose-2'-O)-methylase RlmE/FtsJ